MPLTSYIAALAAQPWNVQTFTVCGLSNISKKLTYASPSLTTILVLNKTYISFTGFLSDI